MAREPVRRQRHGSQHPGFVDSSRPLPGRSLPVSSASTCHAALRFAAARLSALDHTTSTTEPKESRQPEP